MLAIASIVASVLDSYVPAPETEPFDSSQFNVIVYFGASAINSAVIVISSVTNTVWGFSVNPSLQPTNLYPGLAWACTCATMSVHVACFVITATPIFASFTLTVNVFGDSI